MIPPGRELHPLVDWSAHSGLLPSISVRDIKAVLRRRQFWHLPEACSNTEVAGALERSELLELLKKSFPAWLAPPLSHSRGGISKLSWSSKYKLCYAAAIHDGKRGFITAFELCSPEWRLTFPAAQMQYRMQDPEAHSTWATFDVDGLTRNGMNPGVNLEWHFEGDPEGSLIHPKDKLKEAFNPDREKKRRAMHASQRARVIQVERFPALSVARSRDWGWVLSNNSAKLTSTDTSRILPDNPELWEVYSRWWSLDSEDFE
ncbi:hypothetical protein HDU93_003422 [Gonapodya sp. JEL0774]|nr:hypothetical protein HDU93_003422 [Gonapodya sp. JEL0774]